MKIANTDTIQVRRNGNPNMWRVFTAEHTATSEINLGGQKFFALAFRYVRSGALRSSAFGRIIHPCQCRIHMHSI